MANKPRRFDLSPDNFLAGIGTDLKADELGLYWLICLKNYSACGPVPYDEEGFGTLLHRTDLRIIKRASARLQHLNKITVTGGYVFAKGCASHIEDASNRVATAAENGRKGGRPRNNNNDITKPDGFDDEKLPSPPQPPSPPESSLRSDGEQPKKATRSNPKTVLPENFPQEGDLKWAQDRWLQRGRADLCNSMDDEVQKFRDHHTAKNTRSADWSASWRTWAGNAMNWSKGNRNGSGSDSLFSPRASAAVSAAARTIDRIREADRVSDGNGQDGEWHRDEEVIRTT